MMVAVGFSPRGGSGKTGRRGATLEGLDWLFGSGVAPRRVPFPQPIFPWAQAHGYHHASLRDFPKSEMRPPNTLKKPGSISLKPDDSDRKSTRLNSSHRCISYAVFCLKKKKKSQ